MKLACYDGAELIVTDGGLLRELAGVSPLGQALPAREVVEVSPRDGLQNEAAHVSTQHKLELIDMLVAGTSPSNGHPNAAATSRLHLRPASLPISATRFQAVIVSATLRP